jgi:hypothetical protein
LRRCCSLHSGDSGDRCDGHAIRCSLCRATAFTANTDRKGHPPTIMPNSRPRVPKSIHEATVVRGGTMLHSCVCVCVCVCRTARQQVHALISSRSEGRAVATMHAGDRCSSWCRDQRVQQPCSGWHAQLNIHPVQGSDGRAGGLQPRHCSVTHSHQVTHQQEAAHGECGDPGAPHAVHLLAARSRRSRACAPAPMTAVVAGGVGQLVGATA